MMSKSEQKLKRKVFLSSFLCWLGTVYKIFQQFLVFQADEDLNNEIDSNKKIRLAGSMETVASPSEIFDNILNNKDPASEHQNEHENSPLNGDTEVNNKNASVLQGISSTRLYLYPN